MGVGRGWGGKGGGRRWRKGSYCPSPPPAPPPDTQFSVGWTQKGLIKKFDEEEV